MELMKVLKIAEPGKFDLCEEPIPAIEEGEALLKIKYCGICGSDLATYTGNQPFASYPRIPGHEFSAEIAQIGDNDRGLKVGMLVTANPYFNCGECYSCRRGKVNCCESNETMGVQRDGAFSEYIVMPIKRIYPANDVDPQVLALVEPFSISYHAIQRGGVNPGDKVLVIGAGAIGIFAMYSAKLKGAQVYIADVFEEKLQKALELGADGIINVGTEDLKTRVLELTSGNGMDVCIEAVGLPQTFLQSIDAAAFGSKVILIGNGKKETTFNHSILLKKELDVYGSRNSLNVFEDLIDLIKSSGKSEIEKIITHIYPLDKVKEAFDTLLDNDGSRLKVLINFA